MNGNALQMNSAAEEESERDREASEILTEYRNTPSSRRPSAGDRRRREGGRSRFTDCRVGTSQKNGIREAWIQISNYKVSTKAA